VTERLSVPPPQPCRSSAKTRHPRPTHPGRTHERGKDGGDSAFRRFGVRGVSAFFDVHVPVGGQNALGHRIQNASEDEVWRRESALLIAECKNWSGKCGKDKVVLFRSKLENRTGRVSCGFLISWNGFAETVTAEMLRGTKEKLLATCAEREFGRDREGEEASRA
jgi:hypothetical protein